MMIEFTHDDLIARCEILSTISLCHQVDTLGGTTHKDDLLATGSIDKALYLFARLLVGIGCTGSQRMGSAMDV